MKERITRLISQYSNGPDKDEFNGVKLNQSLFDKMVEPVCFDQCAKTDVDILFLNEMECTYKCMITYKQAFNLIKNLD
ncbi:unnamed protein product [Moneuplotes crassus]|uniref:Uncharacterized protein n=1 Tax=Euplotes crassus TaxID=5936 RepID=A0AAD1Y776_EUPCR|nr:unnamed protein product [Moneuplotes crassus]